MPIVTKVELAFGADLTANPATWTWTDVSQYVLGSARVEAGRADEASQTRPTSLALRLRNTDARFSPRFPTSPYYPNVRRQTPIRVSLNPGTGYVQRFQGYVDQFKPVWPGGNSAYAEVQIVASGILRRLGQGKVLQSALYRAISQSAPLAYWPLEDGPNSFRATGFNISQPLWVTGGKVAFAAAGGLPSSAPLADFSSGGVGGRLTGTVPVTSTFTSWRVEFVTRFRALQSGDFVAAVQWTTSGGVALWEIDATPLADGGLYLQYIDSAGGFGGPYLSGVAVDDDAWHHIRVDAAQSGGNIAVTVRIDGVAVIGQTLVGLAMGRVTTVVVNPTVDPYEGVPAIGHVAVWSPWASSVDTVTAFRGYAGETAGARIVRLCAENNVPASVSSTTGTARMGPQTVTTLLSLLRECEAADGGILYDGQSAGVTYLARKDRYNLPVALALDCDSSQVQLPFTPVEDDQQVRNDWTVYRTGGSSDQYKDGVHIAANGRYDDSTTLNVERDEDLRNQAAWKVHLGTVDEMRVPGLSLQLANHPELWASWLAMTLGKRLTVVNLPAQYPPGTLDMLAEGYTETWSARTWQVDFNTSPFAPWSVFQIEDDILGRPDTEASALAIAASSSATSLTVVTTFGPLWSTTATPYDVHIGGERITATTVASAIRETFTGSAGAWPGSQTDSGQVWAVGAGTPALFTRTGTVGQIAVSATNVEHHIAVDLGYATYQRVSAYQTLAVTPSGAGINWGVMLRRAGPNDLYWIDVQIDTGGGLTLRVISKIGGVNTQLATAVSATRHSTSVARILLAEIGDDDIIRAKVWADGAAEPGWELVFQASTTDLQVGTSVGCITRLMTGNTNGTVTFNWDNFVVLNPQVMTVTRSVNGVVKSQGAGQNVNVWKPGIGGLAL